jgi:hypothetical protein
MQARRLGKYVSKDGLIEYQAFLGGMIVLFAPCMHVHTRKYLHKI